MLANYRVLDLTDERGILCGKILGDLGADVLAIEPPLGNIARRQGPFYQDVPDPENSLFWGFFATNKRSITLDLQTPEGQAVFHDLVRGADAVCVTVEDWWDCKVTAGHEPGIHSSLDFRWAASLGKLAYPRRGHAVPVHSGA